MPVGVSCHPPSVAVQAAVVVAALQPDAVAAARQRCPAIPVDASCPQLRAGLKVVVAAVAA